jgi:probable phosphoglycerate mutase
MSQLNIYLIRHAESQANINPCNVVNGLNLDSPLTEKGRTQALLLGKHLQKNNTKCDVAFSSHALRTQQTSKIVLDNMEYAGWCIVDESLIEQNSGDWEGISRDIYNRPDVRMALDTDNWNFIPGEVELGESQNQVAERMLKTINKMVSHYSQYPYVQNIFVFTHSMAIKYMLAKLFKLDLSTAYKIACENTSITRLRFEHGHLINPLVPCSQNDNNYLLSADGQLVKSNDLWNDTTHLLDLQ